MTSREFTERLTRRARKVGLQPSADVVAGLETYYRLLETWNRKINLTALDLETGADSTIDRLLIEPLVAASHIDAAVTHVIDIGSGGGSPAIPMHIARPDLAFTLVEVKTRKSAFLREAARQLKLNTTVETARFEALLARPDLHEKFGVATMRAVRLETKVLVGLQAFVKPNGRIFLFRGPSGADVPSIMAPALLWEATYPLVDNFQSRLCIVKKMEIA